MACGPNPVAAACFVSTVLLEHSHALLFMTLHTVYGLFHAILADLIN